MRCGKTCNGNTNNDLGIDPQQDARSFQMLRKAAKAADSEGFSLLLRASRLTPVQPDNTSAPKPTVQPNTTNKHLSHRLPPLTMKTKASLSTSEKSALLALVSLKFSRTRTSHLPQRGLIPMRTSSTQQKPSTILPSLARRKPKIHLGTGRYTGFVVTRSKSKQAKASQQNSINHNSQKSSQASVVKNEFMEVGDLKVVADEDTIIPTPNKYKSKQYGLMAVTTPKHTETSAIQTDTPGKRGTVVSKVKKEGESSSTSEENHTLNTTDESSNPSTDDDASSQDEKTPEKRRNDPVVSKKMKQKVQSTGKSSKAARRRKSAKRSEVKSEAAIKTEHSGENHVKIDPANETMCVQCGTECHTAEALVAHLQATHRVDCDLCDEYFFSESTLKRHKKVHNKFQCETCGARLKTENSLRNHRLTHSRPFKCEHCGACYANRGGLAIHVRKHTGDRPFKCSTCTSAFRKRAHLQMHERLHTGEKPFQCEYCGRRFSRRGNQLIHMKQRHFGMKTEKH